MRTSLVISLVASALLVASCNKLDTTVPESTSKATSSAVTSTAATSEIYGEVSGCFDRTTKFTFGKVEMYSFPLDRASVLFEKLEEYGKTKFPADQSSKEFMDALDKSERQKAELIQFIRAHAKEAHRAFTKQQTGKYVLTGLISGQEYLVIAVIPGDEQTEPSVSYKVTPKLPGGRLQLDFFQDDSTKENCHT